MCCDQLKNTLGAKDKSKCFSNSTSASENRRKFSLENPDRKPVCRIKVDGCLINDDNVPKCDYLFTVCNGNAQKQQRNKYYLVELKGGDVKHAVKQIISTFKFVNDQIRAPEGSYKGVIVSSGVPGADQRFRRLQDECLKQNRFSIIKRTHQYTEKI